MEINEQKQIQKKQQYDKWNTGLFDCVKDKQNCWEILLCHHLHLSKQYNKLRFNNYNFNYDFCVFILLLDFIFPIYGTILATLKIRNMIQQKYNLYEHDAINDIFTSFCCTLCSICQNHREMSHRGDYVGNLCSQHKYEPLKNIQEMK